MMALAIWRDCEYTKELELTYVGKIMVPDMISITNSVMPKKKSATKRSVPIDKLSMVETLQMKIIELEQELRIQKASMASMNVVPNNIGQNSVETMSAFAENLCGKFVAWTMTLVSIVQHRHRRYSPKILSKS